jgi:tetratricopeptide (TPR) repeat protein
MAQLCSGVLEAGWLAAVVVIPVFFNPFSLQGFEPDKIGILRSVAMVMFVAWVVQAAERWPEMRRPRRHWLRLPMLLPASVLIGAYSVGTMFSVMPGASFWGSYLRSQGLYTLLCYAFIGLVIATELRRPEQLERLVAAFVATSTTVALYGIIQRLGLDPVSWESDVSIRVRSTLGSPVFASAYLIILAPLVAARTIQSFGSWRSFGKRRDLLALLVYSIAAAILVVAIVFTQSRGPWTGLAAGMFLWSVLVFTMLRSRWVYSPFVIAAIILGAVLLLNAPAGPLQPLRDKPFISRVSHIFESRDPTSHTRVLAWGGVADMMLPHPPLAFSDGGRDRLNALRPIVGYGPETMYDAFNQFYPPALGPLERQSVWDRAHNETWQTLYSAGLLGLVAYCLFFGSIFFLGLRWLGLIEDGVDRRIYLACYVGSGAVGAVVPIALGRLPYSGLGLPFGSFAGLIGYLLYVNWKHRGSKQTELEGNKLLIAALLSGIASHVIESQFGIAMSSTWLYLWVLTGAVVAIGRGMSLSGEPSVPTDWRGAWLVAVLFVSLAFDFSVVSSPAVTTVPLLFGLSGCITLALTCSGFGSGVQSLAAGAAVCAAFALFQSGLLGVGDPQPQAAAATVTAVLARTNTYVGFVGCLGVLLIVGGGVFTSGRPTRFSNVRWSPYVQLLAGAGVIWIAGQVNTRSVRADMVAKDAAHEASAMHLDTSIALYRAAVDLSPTVDQFHQGLARTLIAATDDRDHQNQWPSLWQQALDSLLAAERLDPLGPTNAANLARYWMERSKRFADGNERPVFRARSEQYWQRTLVLAPTNATMWNAWAGFHASIGNDGEALRKLQQSLRVDAGYNVTHAQLGDYWIGLANRELDPGKRRADVLHAVDSFRRSIDVERVGTSDPPLPESRIALGNTLSALEMWDAAAAAHQDALRLAQTEQQRARALQGLAVASFGKRDMAAGLAWANQALAAFTDAVSRADLQALIARNK